MGTTNAAQLTDGNAAQVLQDLRRRHGALRDRKIQVEATAERLRKDLEEAEKSATERFGTSDVDKLREIVTAAREANARALDECKANLDGVEAGLAGLNRSMEEVPAAPAGRRS